MIGDLTIIMKVTVWNWPHLVSVSPLMLSIGGSDWHNLETRMIRFYSTLTLDRTKWYLQEALLHSVILCESASRDELRLLRSLPSIGIQDGTSAAVCAGVRLTLHRPLVGVQDMELGLVDCCPVVLQNAAGIPRVRIPCPVGVVDGVRFQEVYQGALPYSSGILTHGATPELSHEHRSIALHLEVGPMLLPDCGKVVGEVWGLEPGLLVDFRSIVMGRIHQLVWF